MGWQLRTPEGWHRLALLWQLHWEVTLRFCSTWIFELTSQTFWRRIGHTAALLQREGANLRPQLRLAGGLAASDLAAGGAGRDHGNAWPPQKRAGRWLARRAGLGQLGAGDGGGPTGVFQVFWGRVWCWRGRPRSGAQVWEGPGRARLPPPAECAAVPRGRDETAAVGDFSAFTCWASAQHASLARPLMLQRQSYIYASSISQKKKTPSKCGF